MSLAQLFYLKETFRERVRQWRQACFARDARRSSFVKRLSSLSSSPVFPSPHPLPLTPHGSCFTLESLEPRVLLSATPTTSLIQEAAALEPAAVTVPHGNLPSLDVDLNGTADALTDGILIMRHLFGFTGNALTNGAVDLAGQRTDPTAIANYVESIRPILDVELNGQTDALTDGIVIVRYLFGFTGDALINGVVDPAGTRHTAATVEAFLSGFLPVASPTVQEATVVASEPVAASAPITTTITTPSSEAPALSVPLVVMESATTTTTPVVATDTNVPAMDLVMAYVQRSWVKDYVVDGVSLAEEDEELLIALPG